jgi:tetratricopeptide (TPR) repeat protein
MGDRKQVNNNINIMDMSANDQESIQAFSFHGISNGSTPMYSMHSSKTDLSDVGLCSFNVHENNYNILLCHLKMKDYQKSLEKLSELIGQTPKKYQKLFFLLRGMVYEVLGQKDNSAKEYLKFEKLDKKAYDKFFKENKDFIFEPFP